MSIKAIGRIIRNLGLAALLLASLYATSCDNAVPLFSSIQDEPLAASRGPFYRSSVGEVLPFNSRVWARRATIVATSSGSANWSTVSVGELGTGYECSGLAATTTTLYAAIRGKGLWSSDGTTWTKAVDDATVVSARVANGQIFVIKQDEKGTTTDSSDDVWTLATSGNSAICAFDAGNAILDLVWDGSSYWVLTQKGLWSSTSAASGFAQRVETGVPTGSLASIAAGGSGRIYVGTDAGAVYGWNGSAWTAAVPVLPSLTVTSPAFVRVAALAELPAGTATLLVAGIGGTASGATGYVELSLDLTTAKPSLPSSSGSSLVNGLSTNYATLIADKPVSGFYYFTPSGAVKPRLYAAMAGQGSSGASGLYYDDFDASGASSTASGWSGWTAE